MTRVTLRWHKFASLTEARAAFGDSPVIYVQSDAAGRAVRVGKTVAGLRKRYWGGTGYALDAAMHGSGNQVYVAKVRPDLAGTVEATLIWEHRAGLRYNNMGVKTAPNSSVTIRHTGEVPHFG